jgi:hypothetical protein
MIYLELAFQAILSLFFQVLKLVDFEQDLHIYT